MGEKNNSPVSATCPGRVQGGAVHLSSVGRPPMVSGRAREADGRRWGERRGSRETGSPKVRDRTGGRRSPCLREGGRRPEFGGQRLATGVGVGGMAPAVRCGGSSSAGRALARRRREATAPDSALVRCLCSRPTPLTG